MTTISQSLRERDRRFLWHPYSKLSYIESEDFPVMTRGKGIYLFDSDGKRYIDAISSWWACNLGHTHPRLTRAIRRQSGKMQHSILGNISHPSAIDLAERLSSLFPGGNRRVFFAGDGASAVEAALKMAIQYQHNLGNPERHSFISIKNAYHGDTLGAVGVGYMRAFHAPFEHAIRKARQTPSPCCATCAWMKNPATCDQECFEPMRKLMELHSHETTAVILESLCQCAGGMLVYSPKYLQKLAKLCKRLKILLIVDEIAMGFGRAGKMFAFEHAGIDPDIVCIGKGLSGGYLPISAVIAKEKIYETFADTPEDKTFYHGHTFAGNPIATQVALETLKIYEEENIVEQAASSGAVLQQEMSRLSGLPGVRNVRGIGMLSAAELEHSETRLISKAQNVRQALLKRGILLRPLGDVVYLMPPLITPEKTLRKLVAELRKAIESSEINQ